VALVAGAGCITRITPGCVATGTNVMEVSTVGVDSTVLSVEGGFATPTVVGAAVARGRMAGAAVAGAAMAGAMVAGAAVAGAALEAASPPPPNRMVQGPARLRPRQRKVAPPDLSRV